ADDLRPDRSGRPRRGSTRRSTRAPTWPSTCASRTRRGPGLTTSPKCWTLFANSSTDDLMALSLAQVLNDSHYALGAWSDNQAFMLQAMTNFSNDNDLIAYLQANRDNPQITGNLSANFPPWALQALGDQVGASAAYLNTELAPIIVEAAAQGWDS